MDFESPDVEKDFPGLYASDSAKKSQDHHSDYSDEEKVSKKDLLIGKRKERKESKKDKGYVAFEGESSEDEMDETKSPGRQSKKTKVPFKFSTKDKKDKSLKMKEGKESKKDEEKDVKDAKKDKEGKDAKKKKERKVKLGSLKHKKKKHLDEKEEKPIFGVPLQVAVERNRSQDGIELPVIVRECIDYIEEHGLASEGIYRLSGVKSKVQQLRSKYNHGEQVFLYEHEPHIVASLLKQFLRELPEPVLTNELIPKFEEAASLKDGQRKVETLHKLLQTLPTSNYLLLSWVFVHMLHVIQMEKKNKMNLQNVSIVLSPTMQISHRVLHALFEHSSVLFKGVQIKKYSPIRSETSRQSLEMPDTPATIEEELGKQENILNRLHAELNTGLRDKQKEEQLWEVQRVITQLKRKLRFLKQMQDKSKTGQADSSQSSLKNSNEQEIDEFHVDARLKEPEPKQKEPPQEKPAEATEKQVAKPVPEEPKPEPKENKSTADTVDPAVQPEGEQVAVETAVVMPPVEEKETEIQDKQTKVEVERIPEHVPEAKEKVVNEELSPQKMLPPIPIPQEIAVQPEENEKMTEEDGEPLMLLMEERMLLLQQEELLLLGEELRKKINAEQLEVERLKLEIVEYQQLYKYKQYSFDSSENSSSSESDSSESVEEEDLQQVLEDLIKANKQLEENNADLSNRIQKERETCMDIKVQMKCNFFLH